VTPFRHFWSPTGKLRDLIAEFEPNECRTYCTARLRKAQVNFIPNALYPNRRGTEAGQIRNSIHRDEQHRVSFSNIT
jgi:hypothetical protein